MTNPRPAPTPLRKNLTGSFSSPAGGNPTGAMVEAAYAHHEVLARFVNCDVQPADLADAVRGAVAMGWLGFSLSLPHKQAVLPLLDDLAESAGLIGAVNCVVVGEDRRLTGNNTDGQGFVAALRTRVDPRGQRVVLFGAGGAARAIAVELALAGAAAVRIVNRDAAKAEAIAALLRERIGVDASASAWQGPYAIDEDATIAVNATSVGLAPHADAMLDVEPESLRSDLLVCDVIPNPPETAFLREAARRGATTLDGRWMLVNQAAINLGLWLGLDPDRAVMHEALSAAIGDWRHPTTS
ncbi:shikimate dehydrogenase family protein [Microbacterium allomyrinae]|nr:shikimate dehydrogenase [Microbacterium allomyrinae]